MVIFCVNRMFQFSHKSCSSSDSLSVHFAVVHFATKLESARRLGIFRDAKLRYTPSKYTDRHRAIQNGDAYRDGTGDVVRLCNNGNSWCLCCEVVASASYTCETADLTWLDTLPRILFRVCRGLCGWHRSSQSCRKQVNKERVVQTHAQLSRSSGNLQAILLRQSNI